MPGSLLWRHEVSSRPLPCNSCHSYLQAYLRLVSELLELLFRLVVDLGMLLRLRALPQMHLLLLVVRFALHLASLFQPVDSSLIFYIAIMNRSGLTHTEQQHPGISSQPRGSVYQQRNISSRVLTSGSLMLAALPYAFSYRKGRVCPRRPLSAPSRRPL